MVYAVYAVFKTFLSEATKSKVTILRGNLDKVYDYIDKKNLPDILGGEVKNVWPNSLGPWKKYLEKCNEKGTYYLEKGIFNEKKGIFPPDDPWERAKTINFDNLEGVKDFKFSQEKDFNFKKINDEDFLEQIEKKSQNFEKF